MHTVLYERPSGGCLVTIFRLRIFQLTFIVPSTFSFWSGKRDRCEGESRASMTSIY